MPNMCTFHMFETICAHQIWNDCCERSLGPIGVATDIHILVRNRQDLTVQAVFTQMNSALQTMRALNNKVIEKVKKKQTKCYIFFLLLVGTINAPRFGESDHNGIFKRQSGI